MNQNQDFSMFYNRHYIKTDDCGRIIAGWSDGPHRDRDTADAICINEQGGYQFQLFPDGAENPSLHTMDGIALYKWDGESVIARSEEEITADRPDPLPLARAAKLRELSAACNAAITAGCAVETSQGREHFSLQETDQINLSTAMTAIQAGAAGYPYHADGELCRMFSGTEIQAIAQKATVHKLEHITYFNHLAAWVRRCETAEALTVITYGTALPQDLEDSMAAILAAAGGGNDAV